MDSDNKYGTLEIQKKLLNLLKEFHQFCINNDIKYSLDWGSLLGAIRHKGFIPWDDDLDIMVDRVNYEKIRSTIRGNLVYEHGTSEALWIDRIRLDSDTLLNPKPTMDVFIIDNAPNGKISQSIRVLLLRFLQGMLKDNPNFKKGNLFYRLATLVSYCLGSLFSRSQKLKLYNWLSQRSNKYDTYKKASYNTDFGDLPKLYEKNVIDEVIEVPFEDIKCYITKAYHQCLIDKFGLNYMTPPIETDRIPKHS